MSKMNKKLPALFLALVLVLGMTACGGKATDGTTGSTDNTVTAEEEDHKTQNTKVDPNSPITEEMLRNHAVAPAEDFTYDVEDDGIKIRSYTGSDTVVVIPEEIEGKPVTGFYDYVFANDNPVRAVLIPESVKELEQVFTNIKIENKSIKQTLIKAINSTVPKANQKNININIEDFEDIEIPHDTKWTEESIFNVLENAVKYSSENKDINVQVSETINFIRIDIKDNGIGIDKSEYNNIFKRFYRSEKVDDIEGSGIGLYLSRKILEKQGGNIIVSSQKEQGSKFSLFLTKV